MKYNAKRFDASGQLLHNKPQCHRRQWWMGCLYPPFCLTRLFLWVKSHVHSMRPDSFELIQPETTNFSIHSITWITHLFHYEQLPHHQVCHLTLHLNILCAVFGGGCALLWIIGWIEFKNHILKTVMKGFMPF